MPWWGSIVIMLYICCYVVLARRRVSAAERAFEKNEGLDWAQVVDDDEGKEKESEDMKTSATEVIGSEQRTGRTLATTNATEPPAPIITTDAVGMDEEKDVITQLLLGAFDIINITKQAENDYSPSLGDDMNRTVLWIDASYKAENFKLNVSSFPECQAWQKYWSVATSDEETKNANVSHPDESPDVNLEKYLKESELIDDEKRLKQIGLSEHFLQEFKAVGLLYKEICGNHGRVLWFKDTADAKKIGITETSPICEPFKEELTPDMETLMALARTLNNLVQNFTLGIIPEQLVRKNDETKVSTSAGNMEADEATTAFNEKQPDGDDSLADWSAATINPSSYIVQSRKPIDSKGVAFLVMEDTEQTTIAAGEGNWEIPSPPIAADFAKTEIPMERQWQDTNRIENYDDDYADYGIREFGLARIHDSRGKRSLPSTEEEDEKRGKQSADGDDDDEWLFNVNPLTDKPEAEDEDDRDRADNTTKYRWVSIEQQEEGHSLLFFSYAEAAQGLALKIPEDAFQRFEKIGLYLPGICADYVPKAIDEFDSSSFEGVEIEGPIGVNISALEAAGVNLTALAEKLRNDTEVDEILSRTNASTKTLGGSFILPVLNKNQYDPFSAPIVFQGSAVVVRFGIYIESMSNFQTSTMDYDMDIYLMMSWRDARLVNPYDKPILVKEEEILEKIWRPDPFFANAKEAEFHEVTFLNFLMRIFPDGLVLYETRIKIKPSCNLILCKYPHDKQTCDLLIKSFAYPVETVRFEWFTRRIDAIDKNPDVKLPELYIDRYEPTVCTKTRKSGAFSCLRAVFRLKRDVGFHIAQTYIPTSLALMFSWVGVWLPEEFMEGRIGVAITVLLTLSTESAGAREHLPSVSYLKAIDLWFGFITGFVFFTLLQTLFVIGFDKRANQLRKWAMKRKSDITEEVREMMLVKGKRYHKAGRFLDNFCRVFYPLSFVLFLIMYYFVFTEGRQDECINRL